MASLAAQPESENPTGDTISVKVAARADTLSEFALLFTETGRPCGAVSDAAESGSDVNNNLRRDGIPTEPCPVWWIRDLSTLFTSISLVVRLLASAASVWQSLRSRRRLHFRELDS